MLASPIRGSFASPTVSPRDLAECPPTPLKPCYRSEHSSSRALSEGIDIARASIMQLSAKERSNALPLLPRHTMEAIVGAYCEFHATGDKTLFDVLLVLVPDLDQQLFTAAHAAFPDISAEAWNEILQMASQDLPARHKVAHAIIQALANPARKTLRFE